MNSEILKQPNVLTICWQPYCNRNCTSSRNNQLLMCYSKYGSGVKPWYASPSSRIKRQSPCYFASPHLLSPPEFHPISPSKQKYNCVTFGLAAAGRAKHMNGHAQVPDLLFTMSLFTAYPVLPERHALPCVGCPLRLLLPRWCVWKACSAYLALQTLAVLHSTPPVVHAAKQAWQTAGTAMWFEHALQLWLRTSWWACQGDSILVATRLACRSNKYCCLFSDWLAGRKGPVQLCGVKRFLPA